MPELPEVETTCNGIRPAIINNTIAQVIVRHSQLRQPIPKNAMRECIGKPIHSIRRRGKYLLFEMPHASLIVHLGMSGHMRIMKPYAAPQKHDHIDLIFSNACMLRYTDPRRFGLWLHSPAKAEEHPLLCNLGVEPLSNDFNGAYLYKKSRARKIALKKFIMNAHVVVGVGNIYASESLFESYLHPLKAANTLRATECETLCCAIKRVLERAIEAGGTSLKDFVNADGKPGYFSQTLKVYGRQNKPCINCEHPLQSINIGGRNSFFCALCQV